MSENLFDAAYRCLVATDPDEKVALTQRLAEGWRAGVFALEGGAAVERLHEPGRPVRPQLVQPRNLPKRKPTTPEGLAVLFHALTHIEFNAINLGLDALYRFRDMPHDYYSDWIQVADEEAYHFGLLRDHLRSFDHDYGDFDAHNGLWEMALETDYDVMARMALVPRCLEARGLDVSPGIRAKLVEAGDEAGAALLDIILLDEIGHVAIGNRWFHQLCNERGVDVESSYRALLERHMKGQIRGPFHREARLEAGFSAEELDYLEGVGAS